MNINPYLDKALPGDREALRAVKTYMIPVSGGVRLYGPEVEVVDTPEFQRLAGIKQLGTTDVVFRGARHTRFEHSLGTVHEANRMVRALRENPRKPFEVPPQAWRLARLGALLHDVPHVPYGHTLEDELGLLERHDENDDRWNALVFAGRIGEILRRALGDDETALLRAHLTAKNDKDMASVAYPYVADIIGNTLCSDLLDYAARDLAACGMPPAYGDNYLAYLTVTDASEVGDHGNRLAVIMDKRGMPRPDVESQIVRLLEARYELAERVYYHHAKNAASVMLGRAVLDAGLAQGPAHASTDDSRFWWLSDDLLLQLLETPALGEHLEQPIQIADAPNPGRAGRLARAIRERRLFKLAYLATADDVQEAIAALHARYADPLGRANLEDGIAAKAGAEPGSVLIHLPRPKMMTKNADVRVIGPRGVLHLQDWDRTHSGRLEALNAAHRRLWRVAVYVSPEVAADEAVADRIEALAADEFRTDSRLSEGGSRYLRTVWDQHAAEKGWVVPGGLRAIERDIAAMSHGETLDETIQKLDDMIRLSQEPTD